MENQYQWVILALLFGREIVHWDVRVFRYWIFPSMTTIKYWFKKFQRGFRWAKTRWKMAYGGIECSQFRISGPLMESARETAWFISCMKYGGMLFMRSPKYFLRRVVTVKETGTGNGNWCTTKTKEELKKWTSQNVVCALSFRFKTCKGHSPGNNWMRRLPPPPTWRYYVSLAPARSPSSFALSYIIIFCAPK